MRDSDAVVPSLRIPSSIYVPSACPACLPACLPDQIGRRGLRTKRKKRPNGTQRGHRLDALGRQRPNWVPDTFTVPSLFQRPAAAFEEMQRESIKIINCNNLVEAVFVLAKAHGAVSEKIVQGTFFARKAHFSLTVEDAKQTNSRRLGVNMSSTQFVPQNSLFGTTAA